MTSSCACSDEDYSVQRLRIFLTERFPYQLDLVLKGCDPVAYSLSTSMCNIIFIVQPWRICFKNKPLVTHPRIFWSHVTKHTYTINVEIGQVPDSLIVRQYEPGRENHEFDPRLGNFILCVCRNFGGNNIRA